MTASEFMKSRLDVSGITLAEARALGIKAMEQPPAELKDKAGPGFIIPYYSPERKLLKTYRYRRDLERLKGWDKLKADQPKYLQPPATPAEVYFPNIKGHDWQHVMKDPSVPLDITEGELKAIASMKCEFSTIGLGGVWSFMSTKNDVALLPSLRRFVWEGRDVFICYDSDAASNPQVALAEQRLCGILRELKANPRVVRLPTLKGQMKTGLDDFLLSEGADAYEALRDSTPDDEMTEKIDALNAEVVLIDDMVEVYKFDPGRFIPMSKFVSVAYADRIVSTASNGKMVQKNVAAEWLKSTRKGRVDDIAFKPGGPEIVTFRAYTRQGPREKRAVNTWKGWGIHYSKKGDTRDFSELLDYFCQAETREVRRWFEQWLAYPVQFPGTKMYSAVVVWSSETGTGKTLLGEIMGAIYGQGFTAASHAMLEKSFNGWAEGKQFIMGSEITGNDSRKFADMLKDMVTRLKMHVERKYVDSYEVDDCVNYYFTSNHPDAFFLEDQDRRFFVLDVSFSPKSKSFYTQLEAKYLKSDEGKAALLYHLQHVDMTGFSPTDKALPTTAKGSMTQHGKSNVMRWLSEFRTNRIAVMHPQAVLLKQTLYTAEDVFKAYQMDQEGDKRTTITTVGRVMSSMGLKKLANGSQVTAANGHRVYLWADPVANPELFKLTGAKAAELYDKERPTNKKVRKF